MAGEIRRLSPEEHARISAAIGQAERATSGEIFCILSERPSPYPETVIGVAALAALTLPVLAVIAGAEPWGLLEGWGTGEVSIRLAIEAFALVQVIVFALVAALVALTPLEQRLTPRAIRSRRVHRHATEQFRAKGLGETRGRTGVLIFASLPDRHAEVIADAGIYERVSPEHWGETLAALIAGVRRGDLAGGFVEAIGLAGAVLAEHFPAGERNPNELADKLVEI